MKEKLQKRKDNLTAMVSRSYFDYPIEFKYRLLERIAHVTKQLMILDSLVDENNLIILKSKR
jgi:hypothetical protein